MRRNKNLSNRLLDSTNYSSNRYELNRNQNEVRGSRVSVGQSLMTKLTRFTLISRTREDSERDSQIEEEKKVSMVEMSQSDSFNDSYIMYSPKNKFDTQKLSHPKNHFHEAVKRAY